MYMYVHMYNMLRDRLISLNHWSSTPALLLLPFELPPRYLSSYT